jgi:Phosphotransferase enzyme family
MNADPDLRPRVDTDELQQTLQELLIQSTGLPRTIKRLERRRSPFTTSFPLEELTVFFDDGEQLELLFKSLSPRALASAARRVKPSFLNDPLREIAVYRSILNPVSMGTAVCFGSVADANSDRYWLFLEKVLGRELYQIGEVETWSRAARWIARLHHQFQEPEALPAAARNRLIQFDAAYYRQWFERAEQFCNRSVTSADARRVHRLATQATDLITEVLSLPVGLIHGEFYASNVLVQETSSGLRVCPIDWERTAIGPGLIDLAALVGGKWSEEHKLAIAMEYWDELQRIGAEAPPAAEFSRRLSICRLHVAVQWLGWSGDWSPPPEHRQDWLAEAIDLAHRLGCDV